MISNHFINCNSCNTKINLRCQAGYYDIPFKINCPTCSTLIYGKVIFDQKSINIELEIENAHSEPIEADTEEKYYSAELSAEFPTRKMYLRGFSLDEYDGTPFIRNPIFYKDRSKATDALEKSMVFAQYFEDRWKKLKVYFNLFWNNQHSVLYPKLEKEISNYKFIPLTSVNNDLDANMSLRQLLLTTTGLSYALPPETLDEYIHISNLMITNKEIIEKTQKFASTIAPEFNMIEKKCFKLIDDFSKIYEQLIPVIALRNTESLRNVDKEKYGIMTTNFDELSDFYVKSYEWILDNIYIVIALNNISSRNEYTNCANSKTFDQIHKLG